MFNTIFPIDDKKDKSLNAAEAKAKGSVSFPLNANNVREGDWSDIPNTPTKGPNVTRSSDGL